MRICVSIGEMGKSGDGYGDERLPVSSVTVGEMIFVGLIGRSSLDTTRGICALFVANRCSRMHATKASSVNRVGECSSKPSPVVSASKNTNVSIFTILLSRCRTSGARTALQYKRSKRLHTNGRTLPPTALMAVGLCFCACTAQLNARYSLHRGNWRSIALFLHLTLDAYVLRSGGAIYSFDVSLFTYVQLRFPIGTLYSCNFSNVKCFCRRKAGLSYF